MKKLTRYERPEAQPLSNLRREMDRIFNDLIPFSWRFDEEEPQLSGWSPTTDMVETDTDYLIEVDLPGMTKKDININVQDNVIIIEGERKKETEEKHNGYMRRERSFGSFRRSFLLPVAVVEDKIKATFKDGVLKVSVPKAEESKKKSVTIE